MLRQTLQSISRIAMVGLLLTGITFVFIYYGFGGERNMSTSNERHEINRLNTIRLLELHKESNEKNEQVDKVIRFGFCNIIGYTCHQDPYAYSEHDYDESFFGKAGQTLAMPFTHPIASTSQFAYDTMNRAGFVPKAQAAEGLGFAGLSPLMGIWRQMRNIAFLILSLAIISIGFMVMFRTKLNPQTVISVESALPKIIITMILIQFSFAIAGFMVDMMYVLIGFIIITFGPLVDPSLSLTSLLERFLQPQVTDVLFNILKGIPTDPTNPQSPHMLIFWTLPNALFEIFGETFGNILRDIGALAVMYIFTPGIYRVIRDALLLIANWDFTTAAGSVDGASYAIPAFLIVMFLLPFLIFFLSKIAMPFFLGVIILSSLLVVIIRLFILFFSAYIKLLVLVALGPLIIAFEAIPGRSTFSSWLKSIMGELIIFPAALAVMFLGLSIVNSVSPGMSNQNLLALPFMAHINAQSIVVIIGMGIIFLMPDMILTARKLFIEQGSMFGEIGPGMFVGGGIKAVGSGAVKAAPTISTLQLFGPADTFLKKLKLSRSGPSNNP
jgi:hypothetical protein